MIKARYTNETHTAINVVLAKGDVLGNMAGPVEFSVGMEAGNSEFDALELLAAEGKVTVADYVAPAAPVVDAISDRQFFQQLALDGDITKAEALAAVKVGEIPARLQATIDAIPDEAVRFDVEMLVSGATTFLMSAAATPMLWQAMGREPAQLPDFWRRAALLV